MMGGKGTSQNRNERERERQGESRSRMREERTFARLSKPSQVARTEYWASRHLQDELCWKTLDDAHEREKPKGG